MGANLKSLLRRHLATFEAHASAELNTVIPGLLKQRQTTLCEFDDTITRLAGGSSPPFPFPSAADYYIWGSSHTVLGDIQVPFLALNSDDDPIVTVLPVYAGNNVLSPWVVFGVTQKGGHLGWFEEGSSREHPQRWFRRPVLEWLRTMGEEVAHLDKKAPPIIEIDGYLREVGREHIGCKVVEEGSRIIGVDGEGGLLAGL